MSPKDTDEKDPAPYCASENSRFEIQYQLSPVPTFTWRREGEDFVLCDFNEAAKLLTKNKVEKLIGASLSQIRLKSTRIRDDMLRCWEEKSFFRTENDQPVGRSKEKKYLSIYYAFVPPDMVVLHAEDISMRKQAEALLKKKEEELEMKSRELREVNGALRLLLAQNKEEYRELEKRIANNIKELISPYLQRLGETTLDKDQRVYLKVVQTNLAELIEPFMQRIAVLHPDLSHREIEVANLVRMGHTSRDIARLLGITKRAVEFHRDSLRDKLGLKKKKRNLRAYLLSL